MENETSNGSVKWLSPLGYVNAVDQARKRAKKAEEKLLERVEVEERGKARLLLKDLDAK